MALPATYRRSSQRVGQSRSSDDPAAQEDNLNQDSYSTNAVRDAANAGTQGDPNPAGGTPPPSTSGGGGGTAPVPGSTSPVQPNGMPAPATGGVTNNGTQIPGQQGGGGPQTFNSQGQNPWGQYGTREGFRDWWMGGPGNRDRLLQGIAGTGIQLINPQSGVVRLPTGEELDLGGSWRAGGGQGQANWTASPGMAGYNPGITAQNVNMPGAGLGGVFGAGAMGGMGFNAGPWGQSGQSGGSSGFMPDAQTQSAHNALLLNVLQNPSGMSDLQVAQAKEKQKEIALAMQQERLQQMRQNAASRGMSVNGSGALGGEMRRLQDATQEEILRSQRDIDLGAAQTGFQNRLNALGVGQTAQNFGLQSALGMGNLGLGYSRLGLDRELGLEGLGLQRMGLDNQREMGMLNYGLGLQGLENQQQQALLNILFGGG